MFQIYLQFFCAKWCFKKQIRRLPVLQLHSKCLRRIVVTDDKAPKLSRPHDHLPVIWVGILIPSFSLFSVYSLEYYWGETVICHVGEGLILGDGRWFMTLKGAYNSVQQFAKEQQSRLWRTIIFTLTRRSHFEDSGLFFKVLWVRELTMPLHLQKRWQAVPHALLLLYHYSSN
jgi:hypothetical protein